MVSIGVNRPYEPCSLVCHGNLSHKLKAMVYMLFSVSQLACVLQEPHFLIPPYLF